MYSAQVTEFRRLHGSGCFVMPNPWDAGTARTLQGLGFRALATTSAGLAWTLGVADTQVTRDQALEHLRLIAGTVSIPVNADFEDGYSIEPGVVLTGRSEGFVVGRPDIDETIRRLQAYAEAGADCLYAPRITAPEQISAVVAAVAPKPVNLLINAPFITVVEAADLGVRRISVGGTLARAAWGGFLDAAREIVDAGTFARFGTLPDVDGMLRD